MIQLKKCIIALVGPPFVGKTTLGLELRRQSNLILLDVNQARWEIFPGKERLEIAWQEQFVTLTSYQRNHERARDTLNTGKPVLLEATYSRTIYHEMLRNLARACETPLRVLFLDSPTDEEIARRVRKRQEKDDGGAVVKTIDVFYEIRDRYQLIDGVDLLTLESNKSLEEKVKEVLDSLTALRE